MLRRAGRIVLLASALVSGLYFAHPLYLKALGDFLIVSDTLVKADAILVLAGGTPRNERLLHAISLWHRGYGSRIVLSADVAEWQSTEDIPVWRHVKKLAILPDNALVMAPHYADSTKEEARLLLAVAKKLRCETVIIVTSNYHTRRVKGVYEKEWASSEIERYVSAAPSPEFSPEAWWTHRTDSRTLLLEYMKTAWYSLFE